MSVLFLTFPHLPHFLAFFCHLSIFSLLNQNIPTSSTFHLLSDVITSCHVQSGYRKRNLVLWALQLNLNRGLVINIQLLCVCVFVKASLVPEFPGNHVFDADLHQRRGLHHRHTGSAQWDVHSEREFYQSCYCEGDFIYLSIMFYYIHGLTALIT